MCISCSIICIRIPTQLTDGKGNATNTKRYNFQVQVFVWMCRRILNNESVRVCALSYYEILQADDYMHLSTFSWIICSNVYPCLAMLVSSFVLLIVFITSYFFINYAQHTKCVLFKGWWNQNKLLKTELTFVWLYNAMLRLLSLSFSLSHSVSQLL